MAVLRSLPLLLRSDALSAAEAMEAELQQVEAEITQTLSKPGAEPPSCAGHRALLPRVLSRPNLCLCRPSHASWRPLERFKEC